MKIYLSGSVPKGDKEAEGYVDWREQYAEALEQYIDDVELFDPNVFYNLEGDSLAVAGADCWYIQQSDLVIINASTKLGAGTSMEMVIAKYFKRPVITILPRDSHHRRSNLQFNGRIVDDWVHPFVDTFSDIIIEDISDIEAAFAQLEEIEVKDITIIDATIAYAQEQLA